MTFTRTAVSVCLVTLAITSCGDTSTKLVRSSGQSDAQATLDPPPGMVAGVPPDVANQIQAACLAVNTEGATMTLQAAFTAPAESVVAWQEQRSAKRTPAGPKVISPWRDAGPGETLTLCFFDGEFSAPLPPGLPAPLTRARYLIDSKGNIQSDGAGDKEPDRGLFMALEGPADATPIIRKP